MEDDFKIEGVDYDSLDEAGKKLYKQLEGQFKGAYTKKTQALAEKEKAWQAEQKKLTDEAKQYKDEVEGFKAWWGSLSPEQQNYYNSLTPGQQEDVLAERGLVRPEESLADLAAVTKEITGLKEWGQAEFGKMANSFNEMKNAQALFMDLVDFRFKHPEADWKRVLKRSQDDKIRNFDLAYQLEYGDELKEKEVNEAVERRLKEETEKKAAETKLPEFTPGTSVFSPTEKEKPADSWSGASAKFKEGAAALDNKPA